MNSLTMEMTTSASARRRKRRYIAMVVLVVALFGAWSGFWYYAAGQAHTVLEGWRAREAKSGRTYACGSETVGGYPFRMEFACDQASAVFATPPLELKLSRILVAAQIYQPTLLISEFTGPISIADAGKPPTLAANWSLGQASVRGTPVSPERISLVFDDPVVERVSGGNSETWLRAKQLELHGRIAEGSAAEKPVIETVLRLEQASIPGFHPAAVQPMDAEMTAVIRGLNDFAPKPWPVRFREIQQANGRIDITQVRINQGDILAVGNGTLSINPAGRLEGQISVTMSGLETFLDKIGAQRIVQNSPTMDRLAGALDRLSPGLGDMARQQAGANISAGINMLGQQTTLEGKPAVALPLRFTDGAVFLGPIPIGNTPTLF
jgi:hypothetical protein